jgi:peptide/nickel transport system permease protein
MLMRVMRDNVFSCFFIILMLLTLAATALAPVLAPYDPLAADMSASLSQPSFLHIMGTDMLGRDIFSRVLWGGRVSVLLAVAVTAVSIALGVALGVVSGILGGWADLFITGVTNIFQGLPALTLMIAVSAFMESGIVSMTAALLVHSWADVSRVVRGKTLALTRESYVESARALGAGTFRVITRYIMPNLVPDIVVLFSGRIGGAILSMSAMCYFGFGLQPPAPDWGVMINEARGLFRTVPMSLIAPGLCLVSVSFGMNCLGELFRKYYEERQ